MKNSYNRFAQLYIDIDYLTSVIAITENILKFNCSKVSSDNVLQKLQKNRFKFKIFNDFNTDIFCFRHCILFMIFTYSLGNIIHVYFI